MSQGREKERGKKMYLETSLVVEVFMDVLFLSVPLLDFVDNGEGAFLTTR